MDPVGFASCRAGDTLEAFPSLFCLHTMAAGALRIDEVITFEEVAARRGLWLPIREERKALK